MPAFNGSGAIKKKSKRVRIQKARELINDYKTGKIKSFIGKCNVEVVLDDTDEVIECKMPRGIRVRYFKDDNVKVNVECCELIGKNNIEKEIVDIPVVEEKTAELHTRSYNKNKQLNRVREIRQENDESSNDEDSIENKKKIEDLSNGDYDSDESSDEDDIPININRKNSEGLSDKYYNSDESSDEDSIPKNMNRKNSKESSNEDSFKKKEDENFFD